MTPWYQRNLSVQDALARANSDLKSASNAQDKNQALKFCRKAEKALERIDISATERKMLDQIAAVYREHSRVLEGWGFTDEALKSKSEANRLGNIYHERNFVQSAPAIPHVNIVSQSLPSSPPENGIPGGVDSPATSADSPTTQPMCHSSLSSLDVSSVPASVFTKDVLPPMVDCNFPESDERMVDTHQLAYCLGLLQTSPDDVLDLPARKWLLTTKADADEQERLNTMATDLIREYTRDELKDAMAVAEVVCLAPVLERDDFQHLLSGFVDDIEHSTLLGVHALEGLAQVIRGAAPGFIDADDLVRILKLLNGCLQTTHSQSVDHRYRLALTISHILDAMADSGVKDLDRVDLHEALSSHLEVLKASSDSYLVYQAAYASQALLYVPDNEAPWQGTMRRAEIVLKGASGLVSAVKGLDVNGFISGLKNIQKGFEGAVQVFELVKGAYEGVASLTKSGQGFFESLQEGLSFSRKQAWYPALRGIDMFLQRGELLKFKTLVCEAPCRRELTFQWGVCQRLGILAADPLWDNESRQGAIAFLGEIYRNDAVWGQEAQIKQCILDILMQLTSSSSGSLRAAEVMLQELQYDGDGTKQALYQACREQGPGFHPWKVALPLTVSTVLLDRVQNKPQVEVDLRRLQRERLENRGDAIYIPPQAKANLQASDRDTLPLMEKVVEFLDSDGQVFLVLGDSGAGKSTFNRHLEHELWKEYKRGGRIPLFINLPGINEPYQDLIAKQLRIYKFSEPQIKELKEHRQLTLICDGYDETQLKINLHTANMLNQKGQTDTKMIISCRSTYLGQDYRDQFKPQQGDRYCATAANLYTEAIIVPFSIDQIEDYVDQFVHHAVRVPEVHKLDGLTTVRSAEDYMNMLKSVPNLTELVKNPFLLSLSLRALPDVVKDAVDLTKIKVTRLTLYDSFVDQWLEINKHRLRNIRLSVEAENALQDLLDEGFAATAIDFSKDLAAAIFREQDGNPVVHYTPRSDKGTWKFKFFGPESSITLLRESTPLSRTGIQHRFIHRSLLEYFYSRHVYEINETEEVISAVSRDLAGHPLSQRNLVVEPSVIQFLSERVDQNVSFKNELLAIIERSKTDEQASQAAANAITILVRAGTRFNGADLKGIRIPGADLSFGEFDSAQLQGADLRRVNLRNIWLRQANLSNAQMADVRLGEWPYLEEDSAVHCCSYSPDGKTFAVGLGSGMISVYDTTTWMKTYTFRGHTGSVWSVVYSPNGQQIVSGSSDYTARLWDARTGAHGPTLSDHTSCVLSVVYSPNGQQIASGSDDETVRLWDAQTGKPGPTLSGHTGAVHSVVYSPNGQQIASSSSDNTVRLWDTQTGAPGPTLSGHTGDIWSLAYSPSGQQIASVSSDTTVRLWDAQTGAPGPTLRGHTGGVRRAVYSPNGQQIASGSWDKTVRLWDAQTGAPGLTLSGHTDCVCSVVYSPNGQQIASGSWDKTVRLWDTQTGEPGPTLSGHFESVLSVVYSPSGQQIASGSDDNTVRLWDTQTGAPGPTFNGHTSHVRNVVYAPNGQQIASGSSDYTVRLWDAQTGAPGPTLSGHTDCVCSVVYSPNGQQIASGSDDKTVRLWDAQTGTPGPTLSGHTSRVWSVVYSPNGQQIASGSDDSTVRLWDTQTGAPGLTLSGHTSGVRSAVYSPNGLQIASGSWDKTVRLWDTQTGAPGPTLIGHTNYVRSVVYSPSGQQIASGSDDKTVRLWDAQTGAPGPTLSGHTSYLLSVVYSPNGQQIASGSGDKTVRLWDAQTGVPGRTLSGHTRDVQSVAYSPSGHQIASGSYDKTVRLWDVTAGQCLAVVGDFQGPIQFISWSATPEGKFFVTGCSDKSVRVWQMVEEEGNFIVGLRWSSSHSTLAVSDAIIQNTQGLISVNTNLLKQRGAVGNPSSLEEL